MKNKTKAWRKQPFMGNRDGENVKRFFNRVKKDMPKVVFVTPLLAALMVHSGITKQAAA